MSSADNILRAFFWALLIAFLTGVLAFLPMYYVGFQLFPTARPDGHVVMPLGAWLFGIAGSIAIGLIVLITVWYKLFHRFKRSKQNGAGSA